MRRCSEMGHDTETAGTAKSLNFKGSGEMKWPQRGGQGLAPDAGAGRSACRAPRKR
jgi:hypothetical protein